MSDGSLPEAFCTVLLKQVSESIGVSKRRLVRGNPTPAADDLTMLSEPCLIVRHLRKFKLTHYRTHRSLTTVAHKLSIVIEQATSSYSFRFL